VPCCTYPLVQRIELLSSFSRLHLLDLDLCAAESPLRVITKKRKERSGDKRGEKVREEKWLRDVIWVDGL
jgi:hypothetical protein